MTSPLFRYAPHWPELVQHVPSLDIPDLVEMMHRRDIELEDYLASLAGVGKEYATLVVAAADSSDHGKEHADYVCTGTADNATIQEAIDALPKVFTVDPVGRIELLEGTYNFTGKVYGAAGTTTGVGWVTITGQGSLATQIYATGSDTAVLDGFMEVYGIYFSANGPTTILDNCPNIHDCYLVGTNNHIDYTFGYNQTIHIHNNSIGSITALASVSNYLIRGNACRGSITGNLFSINAGILLTHVDALPIDFSDNAVVVVRGTSVTALMDLSTSSPTMLGNRFQLQGVGTANPKTLLRLTNCPSAVVVGNAWCATLEHQVILDGSTKCVIASNTGDGLTSTVTTTFDQILLRNAASNNTIMGNALGANGGNQRYNVNVSTADCVSNNVIPALNDLRGAVTAALNDAGTTTIKTIAASSLPTTPPAHASTHYTAGSDPLTGSLDANARVSVRKNSAGSTALRRQINLIEGTNITLTVADDSVNEEVDVTIAASGGGAAMDVQTFVANGTWTKPSAGQTRAKVILIGGGGSGGSGRKGAAGSARGGGGGGGGGAYLELDIPLSALSATQAVVVGSAAAGASGVSTDSTDGTAGSAGTAASFAGYSAAGGSAGAAGTTSGGAGGAAGAAGWFAGGAGGAGAAAGAAVAGSSGAGPGGGGGGGITAANATTASAAGGASTWGKAGGAGG